MEKDRRVQRRMVKRASEGHENRMKSDGNCAHHHKATESQRIDF